MGLFRKKPVVVKAHQWFKNGDHPLDDTRLVPAGFGGQSFESEGKIVRRYRNPSGDGDRECRQCRHKMHDHGWIDTLEGGHTVCPGDWIIEGVVGEFYPCKPDVFKASYKPVQIKAYIGHYRDEDAFVVAFAETIGRAKARAKALLESDLEFGSFVEVRVRREPKFDRYAKDKRVPASALLSEGWRLFCHDCFKYPVTKDDVGMVDDDRSGLSLWVEGVVLCKTCFDKGG